ncbi:MAG: peptidylprolyl isomerase [Planctomycetota bacterium]
MGRLSFFGCAVLAAAVITPSAAAQVSATRTYYGAERPMPVEIVRPAGAEGDLTVRLLSADNAELASAPTQTGAADLAAMFESLWVIDPAQPTIRYAQLFAGGTPVGPALVLQPMTTPEQAYSFQSPGQRPEVRWRSGQRVVSGVRAYSEQHVVMETTEGEIRFRMRPDAAPNTVWNFLTLADGGYYTDVIFHRVVGGGNGRPPFVIQAGDPIGQGVGGPGFFVDLERSGLPHTFGVLSMARSSDPNSAGSQVFICLSRAGTQGLDGSYTSFAEAVGGAAAILAIESVETGANDRPVSPPVIERTVLVPAPPRGTGPSVIARPEAPDTGR